MSTPRFYPSGDEPAGDTFPGKQVPYITGQMELGEGTFELASIGEGHPVKASGGDSRSRELAKKETTISRLVRERLDKEAS